MSDMAKIPKHVKPRRHIEVALRGRPLKGVSDALIDITVQAGGLDWARLCEARF